MKRECMMAAALFAQASLAGGASCLRGDDIDRIKMTGAATAVMTDKKHHSFDIAFVGPCGKDNPNTYFVVRPDMMPACVTPGTAFRTNRAGVCVVKAVAVHK